MNKETNTSRLRLAHRLALAFGLVLLLTVGTGVVAIWNYVAIASEWKNFEQVVEVKRVSVMAARRAVAGWYSSLQELCSAWRQVR